MLAAGLEGIEKGYELPDQVTNNIYHMTDQERAGAGITSLPSDLSEAIKLAESSDFLKRALGDHLFEAFIENKKSRVEQL
ncbi:MAG: hypothetical protein QMD53_04130 [Actinomycetota bacterium]|nr:hypothetical protein [Actinomycetota bacterium]